MKYNLYIIGILRSFASKLRIMGKVISFMNNKGGVGKTTSAFTIGLAWAKMGKKVLFIDLDSQSNLTSMISATNPLEQVWERTIEDAFIAGPQDGLPIMHTEDPLVDFVPADLDLSNFDTDTSNTKLKEYLLLDLLEGIRDSYDFIILDCPPALGSIIANAMVASDYLVLVAQPNGLSYKGVQMVVGLYNQIIADKRLNPTLQILGVIISRYQKDKISDYFLEQFRHDYGQLILKPCIRKATKVEQATSFNRSIFDEGLMSKATEEYMKVSQELLMRISSDEMHGREE